LPLALDQAGAYMEETGCRLQDYQRIYRQRRKDLLKQRGGLVRSHPEPVAATWSLSFRRVQEKQPAAAELLRLCAFLAPEDIAEEMITQGAPHLGPLLEPIASDAYEFNQAIEVLRAYSLVQRDPSTGALSIHRLVQAVLRDALPAEEAQLWAGRTVCAVNAAFPEVEFAQWSLCERCLPHALVCAEEVERCNMTLLDAASLLHRVGWYLDDRARYREAEPLYQRALAIREQQLGPQHPDTANSLNNLAGLYRAQGKDEQAEPLLKRALAIREQQLGPEHPHTAIARKSYISLLRAMGREDEAGQMEGGNTL
jgi:tetratricopeptide (TPR) repeat protein